MLSGGPGRGGGITLSAHKPQAASSLTMQAISRVSGSGSAGLPIPPRKKAATDQGLLLEIREMQISHAAQLEWMSAQYRDENKRLSETIDNLQNTMQQLTENMRIMTMTASTRTSGEANIDLEEDDFIESPPRTNFKMRWYRTLRSRSILQRSKRNQRRGQGHGSPALQSPNSKTSNSLIGMRH